MENSRHVPRVSVGDANAVIRLLISESRSSISVREVLSLRVAIELLTAKVDQLCHFINENGLEPPLLPLEKEKSLRKILESLGMDELSPRLETTLSKESEIERSVNHSSDPKSLPTDPYVKAPVPGNMLQASEFILETGTQLNLSRPTSPPHHSTASENFGLPVGKDKQSPTQDSPDSILTAWDFDLGVETCITIPPLDSDDFLNLSPSDMLSMEGDALMALLQPASKEDEQRSESSTDIEDIIDEISNRVGTLRISPGGNTQFRGPISAFNLPGVIHCEEPDERPHPRGLSVENQDSLGSESKISPELEEHLLNLYFCWQDPSSHTVDRRIYEDAKVKWQNTEETSFYSDALRCALGSTFESRFHSDLITFPKTLVDFLDYPCVATLQALIILSNHEIGNGKEGRAWLLSGMAMRLAFDLALHLDISYLVSGGAITAEEADLRRTVFWSAYTVDHQLVFHLGRPFRTSMEDVTVGKPHDRLTKPNQYRWAPYESSNCGDEASGLHDCVEAVSQQLVSLCELMGPCGYLLYGTSRISKSTLQEPNAKIVAELGGWKARLPLFLQINLDDHTSPYLPHYAIPPEHYLRTSTWDVKRRPTAPASKGPRISSCARMCIGSAIAISKILVLYENRYTLRRINAKAVSITSSAILLLLFAAVTKYPGHPLDEINIYLSSCFRALDEFARSWQSARRAKKLLVNLQREWENRTKLNKNGRALEKSAFLPRKRLRGRNGIYQVPLPQHKRYPEGRDDLSVKSAQFSNLPRSYSSLPYPVKPINLNENHMTFELLLDWGANIGLQDQDGQTALFYAAKSGDEKCVQLLLQRGADLHLEDHHGQTPLFVATACERTKIIQLFLEAGAGCDMPNKAGHTPLIHAVNGGHKSSLNTLLGAGVNPDATDEVSRTPLSYATESWDLTIMKRLLEKGASPDLRDSRGGTRISHGADTLEKSDGPRFLKKVMKFKDDQSSEALLEFIVRADEFTPTKKSRKARFRKFKKRVTASSPRGA
ncbi:uncharacterized protein N7483_007487 [Penicillium malachiteum]|uniref:uncharacterized protein n=1 Tax=Penicillium malachiteum TaxID=1324776 RepID=UPI002548A2D4|nr:uncharacterized protein N7483_007487 [Penicillium malachiteum]KAJ5726130.1 hypothetical protein N7483_007487 [Penicillium malachiteum]